MVYFFLSALLASVQCTAFLRKVKYRNLQRIQSYPQAIWLVFIFARYNGGEGLHTEVTKLVKENDCLVCGPGTLIELDTSITLSKVLPLALSSHCLFNTIIILDFLTHFLALCMLNYLLYCYLH